MISNRMPLEKKVYNKGYAAGIVHGEYLLVQGAANYRALVFKSERDAEQFATWTRNLLSSDAHRAEVQVRKVRRTDNGAYALAR